ETITAVTCGWLITSSLLPLWTSAPASAASARARAGSRSEIARNRTAGCLAASRARNVPMRPAPITAMPILSCFIRTPQTLRRRRSSLRYLPHRNVAPIAAHALLVDVDAEPGTVGHLHASARAAHGPRRHAVGQSLAGEGGPPGELRQRRGDVHRCRASDARFAGLGGDIDVESQRVAQAASLGGAAHSAELDGFQARPARGATLVVAADV